MSRRRASLVVILISLNACDFDDPELVHSAPPADAGNNALGELTFDIDGEVGLSILDTHVGARQEIHTDGTSTAVAWILDAREPASCTSESVTCVALTIDLPVVPPLGTYACNQAQVSARVLVKLTDYLDYVAAAGDPCSFDITETGPGGMLRVESFDATWSSYGRPIHVTAKAHAPSP